MRLRGRLDEERRGLSGGPTRAALASPPHAALSEPLCRCKQQQWRQVETCTYKSSNIGNNLYFCCHDCSCGSRLVRFLPPIFPPAP